MNTASTIAAETIADPADPRLAHYGAIRERDLVGRHRRFIVEGEITLRAMLSERARFPIESVLLTPERLASLAPMLAVQSDPPPVYLADRAVMSQLAGFPIHRGVLAVGLRGGEPAPGALIPPAPEPATIVALVGLANHDNVGGIFRNAAAFGADAILLDAATCDPLYRKAIRVSAGAALTVPFARVAEARSLVDLAEEYALVPLALTPGAATEIGDQPLPRRALILLGAEGTGLPDAVMTRAETIRIAMVPGFDSLNVATAGAIVLHQLWTARRSGARDNRRQLHVG